MDESRNYRVKWKKPVTKDHMTGDSIHSNAQSQEMDGDGE